MAEPLTKNKSLVNDSNSQNQFKFFIAIDFGTDGLGLAYSDQNNIYIHEKFESVRYGITVKPKTIILLDENAEFMSFGMDAKTTYMGFAASIRHKWMLFDRFKMSLYEDHDSKSETKTDIVDELKAVNGKKYSSEKVFIEAFRYIHKEAKTWLQKRGKLGFKAEEIQWIITVPAIWNDYAKNKMKQWAIKADLVDANIPNQCRIVYEPDCASLSIQHSNKVKFEKGDKYILIDAGGGTVDIACHEIMDNFGVKEILHPSGGKWGSAYIDDQYIKLLETIFSKEWMDEFKKEEPNKYVEIINNFQQEKAKFYTEPDNETHNVELPYKFCGFLEKKMNDLDDDKYDDIDDKVDEMEIMGKNEMIEKDDQMLEINAFIWKCMFDHVINPITKHVEELLKSKWMVNCKYLCLVGGLSCSPYFQYRMMEEFGLKSKHKLNLVIPNKPILTVIEGAAYFGMHPNYIKARILNASYGIKASLSLKMAKERKIAQHFIDENKYFNKYKDEYYINNVFQILAKKNEEIIINSPIEKTYYRKNPQQKCVVLPIIRSTEENPMIYTDDSCTTLGEIHLPFTNEKETDVHVEFHFYDTTIKVYAYTESSKQYKKELSISCE